MSLITPDFGLLFWMVLIFGILFFILARFGFPVINSMVEKRSAYIEESLQKADEANRRLEDIGKEQEQLISRARIEQGRIYDEAAREREAMLARAREEAAAESAKMIQQARVQIATERENAMRDVRNQIAMISVEVAKKAIEKDLSRTPEQIALIDKMVEESANARMN